MTPHVVALHEYLRQPCYSTGGVEARHVPPPEQVWRIYDIALPRLRIHP